MSTEFNMGPYKGYFDIKAWSDLLNSAPENYEIMFTSPLIGEYRMTQTIVMRIRDLGHPEWCYSPSLFVPGCEFFFYDPITSICKQPNRPNSPFIFLTKGSEILSVMTDAVYDGAMMVNEFIENTDQMIVELNEQRPHSRPDIEAVRDTLPRAREDFTNWPSQPGWPDIKAPVVDERLYDLVPGWKWKRVWPSDGSQPT